VSTIDDQLATDALRRCVLFRRVSPSDLERCTAELAHRHYRRGETIFHAGDPGEALHIVIEGAVKIELPSPSGDAPAILATIEPGGFFGELALLDGAPRSATVVAIRPTATLVLDRRRFEHLMDELPSLRSCLFASLSGELRRLTGQVEALLFLDLTGRLVTRIVDMAVAARAADGAPASGGPVRLAWPYTQAELAAMIGGSRESVNRLLADFVARGLIRFEPDTLVVPDARRLTQEARR
jgi:CRP/FNR family transcriptional regulator, cyclic AMP receptor protein